MLQCSGFHLTAYYSGDSYLLVSKLFFFSRQPSVSVGSLLLLSAAFFFCRQPSSSARSLLLLHAACFPLCWQRTSSVSILLLLSAAFIFYRQPSAICNLFLISAAFFLIFFILLSAAFFLCPQDSPSVDSLDHLTRFNNIANQNNKILAYRESHNVLIYV